MAAWPPIREATGAAASRISCTRSACGRRRCSVKETGGAAPTRCVSTQRRTVARRRSSKAAGIWRRILHFGTGRSAGTPRPPPAASLSWRRHYRRVVGFPTVGRLRSPPSYAGSSLSARTVRRPTHPCRWRSFAAVRAYAVSSRARWTTSPVAVLRSGAKERPVFILSGNASLACTATGASQAGLTRRISGAAHLEERRTIPALRITPAAHSGATELWTDVWSPPRTSRGVPRFRERPAAGGRRVAGGAGNPNPQGQP